MRIYSPVSIYISAGDPGCVFEYKTNVNNNKHHHQPHTEISTTLMLVLTNYAQLITSYIIIHLGK